MKKIIVFIFSLLFVTSQLLANDEERSTKALATLKNFSDYNERQVQKALNEVETLLSSKEKEKGKTVAVKVAYVISEKVEFLVSNLGENPSHAKKMASIFYKISNFRYFKITERISEQGSYLLLLAQMHPEHKVKILKTIERLLRGGANDTMFSKHSLEALIIFADKNPRHQDRIFETIIKPLSNPFKNTFFSFEQLSKKSHALLDFATKNPNYKEFTINMMVRFSVSSIPRVALTSDVNIKALLNFSSVYPEHTRDVREIINRIPLNKKHRTKTLRKLSPVEKKSSTATDKKSSIQQAKNSKKERSSFQGIVKNAIPKHRKK